MPITAPSTDENAVRDQPQPRPSRIDCPSDAYAAKLRGIRRELREEYLQPHDQPWIIGFSGGKDSTLLLHFVLEVLRSIAPDDHRRPVYIVSNDTLVESPVFQSFVDRLLAKLEQSLEGLNVPLKVVRTHPLPEESFWVNLLGKGYPAPNRTFRWCTDRMKIRPTSRFIREIVADKREAILLLGVRRAESAQRAGNIARHESVDGGRLSPHVDHKGVSLFSPIKELTNDEVWITLLNSRPPWGGTYAELVRLYNDGSTECPFVMTTGDAPSCGSSSARFGCWTCTVVDKDKSLAAMIDAGHEQLEPLAALLALREQTAQPLISEHEVRLIREQWEKDQTQEVLWRLAGDEAVRNLRPQPSLMSS